MQIVAALVAPIVVRCINRYSTAARHDGASAPVHAHGASALYQRMAGAHAAPVSEWAPRTRPASGCVCTILTSNLMGAHSWGAAAVEIARNWAIAHGYRYVRFSETSHYNTSARVPRFVKLASENDKPAQFWFKPQAMLSLLERGEEACPW